MNQKFATPHLPLPAAAAPQKGTVAPANVLTMPVAKAPATPEQRADYDEYALLVESTKAPNARKEVLRLRVMGQFAHLLPAETDVARGDLYDLDIGAKGSERKVTGLMKLCKFLTPKVFFGLCSLTIEAFEKHVAEADRGQFLTEARTGGRRITPTKRFKAAA